MEVDRVYPDTLQQAYFEALKFTIDRARGYHTPTNQRSGIFSTSASSSQYNFGPFKVEQRCSRCGALGHTRDTCHNVLVSASQNRRPTWLGGSRNRGGGQAGRSSSSNGGRGNVQGRGRSSGRSNGRNTNHAPRYGTTRNPSTSSGSTRSSEN